MYVCFGRLLQIKYEEESIEFNVCLRVCVCIRAHLYLILYNIGHFHFCVRWSERKGMERIEQSR